MATLGSLMNLGNNLMGAAAPAVTGYIVASTNSFAWAFLVAGMVLAAGIAAFVFLLGPIEPLADPG